MPPTAGPPDHIRWAQRSGSSANDVPRGDGARRDDLRGASRPSGLLPAQRERLAGPDEAAGDALGMDAEYGPRVSRNWATAAQPAPTVVGVLAQARATRCDLSVHAD